jgi:head-tail adaptor|tara:strand:- start:986 stop:1327 length:342 start_codon:yes stop_codon:yes gene_type:complete
MKKIQAGKLNKRISLKTFSTTADGYGGFTIGAAESEAEIWANVKFKNSDILDEFGQVSNKVMVEFLVRREAVRSYFTIGATDVLEYESKQYRVNKIYDVDIDNYTMIVATKID